MAEFKGGKTMYTEIEIAYAQHNDMTFIMEYTYDENGDPISIECVGWHHGEPNDDTMHYKGKLKATFEL